MGEYATYKGESIKIGTCEDMYYLRADQIDKVSGYDFGKDVLDVIRFRFPFPDEDNVEPGHFDKFERGVRIPGDYKLPAELSGSPEGHHSVQFTSHAGYVLSLPCPEQFPEVEGTSRMWTELPNVAVDTPDGIKPLRVGRNGFNGYPVVRQQAYRGGALVTLLRCNACGAIHRLDTLEDAEPVIAAFITEGFREEYRHDLNGWGPAHEGSSRDWYLKIAARIEAGYKVAVTA